MKEEKKKLKNEQKEQKKLAKQRAKEIASKEAELSEGEEESSGSVFAVTFVIVLIWVAILCLIVKLDFGGFGSNVLTPILKDVPVLNLILPANTDVAVDEETSESYGGYDNLKDAVAYIKERELELEYYEERDPATAEYLYKQVIQQIEESDEIKDYAKAYSAMKPKEAAAIFEAMTDNLDLAARILNVMEAEDRGKILGVMDPEIASRLTKIMDPES